MQIDHNSPLQLTYCTNIHPGNGWESVFTNLRRYAPILKQRLAPNKSFGLGLRISDAESTELLEERNLTEFQDFLACHDLYVALINGFPFGSFHNQAVKDKVFAPDWRAEERVNYTLRLITILKRLLPIGMEGGISTIPLSYKRWGDCWEQADWLQITNNLIRIVEALVVINQQEQRFIHLDIEPEPDGLVENSAELIAFYQEWLLETGALRLAETVRLPIEIARRHILDHIQVCLDTCHMSVEYETPLVTLHHFTQAGIKVGRLQISSALQVAFPDDQETQTQIAQQLIPFADSTYLHQVIERDTEGVVRQYPDLLDILPQALCHTARQWRIHFHVPLFVEKYGLFESTQDDTRTMLQYVCRKPFTHHLEIETYTWEVLPPELKLDLSESILREYRWVLNELEQVAI